MLSSAPTPTHPPNQNNTPKTHTWEVIFVCLFLYLIWHAHLRIVRQYNTDNLFHICVVLIFFFSAHEISVNLKPWYFFLSTH